MTVGETGNESQSKNECQSAVMVPILLMLLMVVLIWTLLVFLEIAHKLKEEGNRMFLKGLYEAALGFTPAMNPDRAVFHSVGAARLMQIMPIHNNDVISECKLSMCKQLLTADRIMPWRFVRKLGMAIVHSHPSPAGLGASAVNP